MTFQAFLFTFCTYKTNPIFSTACHLFLMKYFYKKENIGKASCIRKDNLFQN